MTGPRIILSRGRVPSVGAIVIDHEHHCFWKDEERRPVVVPHHHRHTTTFGIVATLLVRHGQIVPYGELYDHLWGERADGGPTWGRDTVTGLLCRHRALIAWLGAEIQTRYGFGLELQFSSVRRCAGRVPFRRGGIDPAVRSDFRTAERFHVVAS